LEVETVLSVLEIEPLEDLAAWLALSGRWLRRRRSICRANGRNVVDSYVAERFHSLLRRMLRELVGQ
jgi:hypothetical protein